jgi:hypothetical protein
LKTLAILAAGACALALAGSAASGSTRVLALRAEDKVVLPGTSLQCAVKTLHPGGPAAVCFKLAHQAVAVGSYSLVVSDSIAVVGRYVDRSGKNKAQVVKDQPRIAKPGFPKAGNGGRTVALKLGDIATIAGSHVVIAAEPNDKKQATLGALLADRSLTPVAGSYGGGVSETEVVLAVVTKTGSSAPILRRTHGH